MDFLEALTTVYLEAPCRVLANALWKTRRQLEQGDFELEVAIDGDLISSLAAYGNETLSVFWTRQRDKPLPDSILALVQLAVIHDDYLAPAMRSSFRHRERYFRLIHFLGLSEQPLLPVGFSFVCVGMPQEAPVVSSLISQCYVDLKPSVRAIVGWTEYPVYAPDLWVWIVDEENREPAALGIAELDSGVREGSLEWIQVLPSYRGRGLGTALVWELLRRFQGCTDFVTVSGRVGGAGDPERLYRRCGFCGDDVWWVLRR
ncbi:MAG: GNAT family N-acetyltransferase [Anaerolineae bacterium]